MGKEGKKEKTAAEDEEKEKREDASKKEMEILIDRRIKRTKAVEGGSNLDTEDPEGGYHYEDGAGEGIEDE